MRAMKKPMLIAGVLAALLLVAGIAAYALMAGGPAAGGNATDTRNATDATTVNDIADIPGKDDQRGAPGAGPVSSIGMGEDGALYAFSGEYGNGIYGLGPNGSIKWQYDVPGQWRVFNVFNDAASGYVPNNIGGINMPKYRWSFSQGASGIGPLFASDDGVLYLYVRENRTTFWNHLVNEDHPLMPANNDWKLEEKLLAISGGRLLWSKTIGSEHHIFDYTGLSAKNGRIYVFDDYSVTVFGPNGSELFRIDNASGQASVDEAGNVYVVPAVLSPAQPDEYYNDRGFKEPSNVLEAYGPDGTLRWQKTIPGQVSRLTPISSSGMLVTPIASRPKFDTLPMYLNGTLYVPLSDGMAALSNDGGERWTKHYGARVSPVQGMPIDSYGNAYLCKDDSVHIVSPNGSEIIRDPRGYFGYIGDRESGTLYDAAWSTPGTISYRDENGTYRQRNFTLEDMFYVNISAHELATGKTLWQFAIVPNATYVTIDAVNSKRVVSPYVDEKMGYGQGAVPCGYVQILPGNDAVYVNYQAATYEWPIELNRSRCAYASTLYALDKKSGAVIWQKPLDSLVTSMAVSDSTVYYGTSDGKIAATNGTFAGGLAGGGAAAKTMGEVAAGGATVTAVAYVLVKVFGIGAVARAKGRLDRNENRTKVQRYVVEHPGSTLYGISQAIGMNVGTVRYHLFILCLNHRIVSYKADGKFVRYFTSSGAYSSDEQFILSVVRRDGMGRLLGLLLERPGLSNGELSRALNMRESNVSRYMTELMEKGIVLKNSRPDGMSSFSIKGEYKEHVAFAVGCTGGQ